MCISAPYMWVIAFAFVSVAITSWADCQKVVKEVWRDSQIGNETLSVVSLVWQGLHLHCTVVISWMMEAP